MITMIRRSFQSKAFKVILWILMFGVAGVFSLVELFKVGNKAAWIAKVNKDQVSYTDFALKAQAHQEQIMALRAQYARFGQSVDRLFESMGFNLDPKSFALDAVIQEALLDQSARKLGVSIDAQYAKQKLSNPLFIQQSLSDLIPFGVMDRSGNINMAMLKQHLNKSGMSWDDFQEKVVTTLQRQLLMQIVAHASYVPDFVLKEHYIQEYLPKKFSILTLSFANALKEAKSKPVSESELKAFFNQQAADRYMVPAKRSGVAWTLDPHTFGVTVSEQDVASYYDNNKASYIQDPSKVQVRHILFKIAHEGERGSAFEKSKKAHEQLVKDPSQFEVLAKTLSDDKETASHGGLLPAFSRGTKEVSFDKAAFVLKEDGNISDVVATKDGFEIVQRVKKIPATYKALSSVEKEIKDALMIQKFTELFVPEMRTLVEQSEGKEGELEKLMTSKGAKKQVISPVARDDKEWAPVLFSLRHKGDADVYVEKGIGFIVQLTGIKESFLPELAHIKPEVEHDLYELRAHKDLEANLNKAYAQAKHEDLHQLEKQYHGSLTTTPWLSKKDESALADLAKKGIPADSLFQLDKQGAVVMHQDSKDAHIIKLDSIEKLDLEAFNAKKSELSKQIAQEEMRLFIVGFVASLFRNAKIEINQSINESGSPIQYEDYAL